MICSVEYWRSVAMIETYELILILTVYTAFLLLAIYYVYPYLKKLLKRGIYIRIGGEEKKEEKEAVEKVKKQEKMPSILGESKFVLSQPLPNTTTNSETENRKEKDNTFAPETKKSEDENVDYETGEGLEIPPENDESSDVDLNDEEVIDVGGDPLDKASGIAYNELQVTAKTIETPNTSSSSDEELAGKVLSENKCTQLVQSIQDARPEYARRITELLELHERKLAEEQTQKAVSKKKQKLYESDDFKKFNVDDIS